jgi:hypothetical protein
MKGTQNRRSPWGTAARTLVGLVGVLGSALASEWEPDLDSEPHRYFQRTAVDRFSRRIPELAAGGLPLDRSSERAFLKSLLRALDIPESSQLLVFSNTSLQLSLINPDNPRALYFSDDLYLGYVPGGKIEVATLDAELGAVFYIFDIPRSDSRVVVERARRCMNCHAKVKTDSVKLLPLREAWASGQPIPWVKVHNLPDYAYFNHSAHLAAGVGCSSCHGRVDQMVKVGQQEPLTMGWCLECHRNPGPNIRPLGEVTNMAWTPKADAVHEGPVTNEAGRVLNPPTHCSGCHR